MSQDERKDKRAKVVSLNVRYKSATVDEFIENHSHDVSKGGIFVKTPTPFPPGTLLKFEIRLAGDMSVISGVGRVVWKREPTQAGTEKPAGMGVKFIKIDDSSRATIDKLVAQKADAGSAFMAEAPQEDATMVAPATLKGIPTAAPSEPGPAKGPIAINAPSPAPLPRSSAVPGASKPSTLTGPGSIAPKVSAPPGARVTGANPTRPPAHLTKTSIGVAPAPRGSGTPAPPGPPVSSGRLPPPPRSEPKGVSAPPSPLSAPPRPLPSARKATMMGIAPPGEGGSQAGPLPKTPSPKPSGAPMFPKAEPGQNTEPVREPTMMRQTAELLEEALKEAGGSMDEVGQNPLFAGTTEGSQAEHHQSGKTLIMTSPAVSAPSPVSAPPPAESAPARPASAPPAAAPSSPLATTAKIPSNKPPPSTVASQIAEEPSKNRAGMVVMLVILLVVVGGAYAWKSGLLAAYLGPMPAPSSAPSASASAVAEDDASPPASASASAAPAATVADASSATDASTTATGVDAGVDSGTTKDAGQAVTAPPPPPYRPPPPAPRPKPTATEPTPTSTDTPPAPTATSTATATATSTATAAPTATATATAAPTAAPAPASSP